MNDKEIARQLEPPFYAAIFNESHVAVTDFRPEDEMVTAAPAQPGFLGLETTRDKKGRWTAVSYWRDMESVTAWQARAAMLIRKHGGGRGLESACPVRVSKIEETLAPEPEPLRAETPAVTTSSWGAFGLSLLAAFPAVAGLLGYE